MKYALESLKAVFAHGYNYQKMGIILSDPVPADYRQKGIFIEGPDERLIKMAGVIDKLNAHFGQDKLWLASQMYNHD